jgi:hypothetical protein
MFAAQVLGEVPRAGPDGDGGRVRLAALIADQDDRLSQSVPPFGSLILELSPGGQATTSTPRAPIRSHSQSVISQHGTRSSATGKDGEKAEEDSVRAAAGCARCDEPATTVVVEFSAVTAYLDLCEEHLADLLRAARPADPRDLGPRRSDTHEFHDAGALS